MKYLMIGIIKLYRKFISPIKPACCRFTPSCSAYALEAFRKRGFFIGFILTVWRILRCNPFCRGGYDPVPEHGLRNPKNLKRPCEECDSSDTDNKSEGSDITEDEAANGESTAPVSTTDKSTAYENAADECTPDEDSSD